jgi:glycosyltransferase involved in cell wall biosynthesis
MKTTIFINGKFTAQRPTGVQRMARCNVQALDAVIAESGIDDIRWVLLCPPNSDVPRLKTIQVYVGGPRMFGLHFWEQCYLPLVSFKGPLISLSGSAPLLHLNQVCTIHDAAVFDYPQAYTSAFRSWYRFLFKWMGCFARRIITVSEFSRDRISVCLKIDKSQITVVHNGAEHLNAIEADDSIWRRLGLEARPYLLAVASVNPTKNLAALIDAFILLPHNDVRLVLVGGENRAVFSSHGLSFEDARIVRAGPVSDAQLKYLYLKADALVFPSVYEGFGLPPLEAMHCGCPVLAAKAASIPEVCGNAAYYFDPHSLASLTAAMAALLDGKISRVELMSRGRERAQSLTWMAAGRSLFEQFITLKLRQGRKI